MKATLDADGGLGYPPMLSLDYEFTKDVLIKNVFLLFNMFMMDSAEYKVIPNLQVRFRSLEDNGSGGKTKVEVEILST